MSYEDEKKRLIEEFESVTSTIRKDWGLKTQPKDLGDKTSQPQRPTGRH